MHRMTTRLAPHSPRRSAGARLFIWCALALCGAGIGVGQATSLDAQELHVSPTGNDANPGTAVKPLLTLAAAQKAARAAHRRAAQAVTVVLHQGIYYLGSPLVFTSADSGTQAAPTRYVGAEGEEVVISGGLRLILQWAPYRDGIMKASVPADLAIDQLFVDGHRQPMARYPNYDASVQHYNGYAADAFSPTRAARWKDPAGGFIHAMHAAEWGDYHYLITGKDANNKVSYVGGWQNNRQMGMHDTYRMVENIFEELDAPGEWFLNKKEKVLYYFPAAGIDLTTAVIEGVRLPHLIEFQGSQKDPVRFLTLAHVILRHAARTFMDNKEPLLRSDWTCYRGGAVFINGAEDCSVEGCWLDQLGGNAIFVNNYNRRITIRSCHIDQAGANGVCFIGDPAAVRNPLFEYGQRQNLDAIDRTPGPRSDNYPADCLVDDCLIHATGRVEKQTAPVEIDMSARITVRDCSCYDVPRAGINIGDGCWGGHIIEGCDVFDTVLETGDNGSFNSWGRDRYWGLGGVDLNKIVGTPLQGLPLLDIVEPNTLRNNRWRCDHGWDIDLDDGSSNYHIYNNLCLNGGIKLREGFLRVVENNIIANSSLHAHVWFSDSQDIFRRNIVSTVYQPIGMPAPPWGKEFNNNLLHAFGALPLPAIALQQQSGNDAASLEGDARYVAAQSGDYRVADGSPALTLGFVSFPTDHYGVRSPALRALARGPRNANVRGPAAAAPGTRDEHVIDWQGARLKNLVGLGEISSTGSPGEVGVIVVDVVSGSTAQHLGLKKLDVIRAVAQLSTASMVDFLRVYPRTQAGQRIPFNIWREQKDVVLQMAGGSSALFSPGKAVLKGDGSHPNYDENKDFMGGWGNDRVSLTWTAGQMQAGTYDVAVVLAATNACNGNPFTIEVAGHGIDGNVIDTGG
jgi:hypothetical protein